MLTVRLCKAAARGETAEVSDLLSNGANPNFFWTGRESKTALHFAASSGHVGTAEVLLKAGAQVDSIDVHGATPLMHSVVFCEASSGEIVKLLIKWGANIHARDSSGNQAVHLASSSGNLSAWKEIFRSCRQLEASAPGWGLLTPLHFASEAGRQELVEFLLDAGGDPNAFDAAGMTPLHWAARYGRSHVCAALIRRGADPASPDFRSLSSRDVALLCRHFFLASLLEDEIEASQKLCEIAEGGGERDRDKDKGKGGGGQSSAAVGGSGLAISLGVSHTFDAPPLPVLGGSGGDGEGCDSDLPDDGVESSDTEGEEGEGEPAGKETETEWQSPVAATAAATAPVGQGGGGQCASGEGETWGASRGRCRRGPQGQGVFTPEPPLSPPADTVMSVSVYAPSLKKSKDRGDSRTTGATARNQGPLGGGKEGRALALPPPLLEERPEEGDEKADMSEGEKEEEVKDEKEGYEGRRGSSKKRAKSCGPLACVLNSVLGLGGVLLVVLGLASHLFRLDLALFSLPLPFPCGKSMSVVNVLIRLTVSGVFPVFGFLVLSAPRWAGLFCWSFELAAGWVLLLATPNSNLQRRMHQVSVGQAEEEPLPRHLSACARVTTCDGVLLVSLQTFRDWAVRTFPVAWAALAYPCSSSSDPPPMGGASGGGGGRRRKTMQPPPWVFCVVFFLPALVLILLQVAVSGLVALVVFSVCVFGVFLLGFFFPLALCWASCGGMLLSWLARSPSSWRVGGEERDGGDRKKAGEWESAKRRGGRDLEDEEEHSNSVGEDESSHSDFVGVSERGDGEGEEEGKRGGGEEEGKLMMDSDHPFPVALFLGRCLRGSLCCCCLPSRKGLLTSPYHEGTHKKNKKRGGPAYRDGDGGEDSLQEPPGGFRFLGSSGGLFASAGGVILPSSHGQASASTHSNEHRSKPKPRNSSQPHQLDRDEREANLNVQRHSDANPAAPSVLALRPYRDLKTQAGLPLPPPSSRKDPKAPGPGPVPLRGAFPKEKEGAGVLSQSLQTSANSNSQPTTATHQHLSGREGKGKGQRERERDRLETLEEEERDRTRREEKAKAAEARRTEMKEKERRDRRRFLSPLHQPFSGPSALSGFSQNSPRISLHATAMSQSSFALGPPRVTPSEARHSNLSLTFVDGQLSGFYMAAADRGDLERVVRWDAGAGGGGAVQKWGGGLRKQNNHQFGPANDPANRKSSENGNAPPRKGRGRLIFRSAWLSSLSMKERGGGGGGGGGGNVLRHPGSGGGNGVSASPSPSAQQQPEQRESQRDEREKTLEREIKVFVWFVQMLDHRYRMFASGAYRKLRKERSALGAARLQQEEEEKQQQKGKLKGEKERVTETAERGRGGRRPPSTPTPTQPSDAPAGSLSLPRDRALQLPANLPSPPSPLSFSWTLESGQVDWKWLNQPPLSAPLRWLLQNNTQSELAFTIWRREFLKVAAFVDGVSEGIPAWCPLNLNDDLLSVAPSGRGRLLCPPPRHTPGAPSASAATTTAPPLDPFAFASAQTQLGAATPSGAAVAGLRPPAPPVVLYVSGGRGSGDLSPPLAAVGPPAGTLASGAPSRLAGAAKGPRKSPKGGGGGPGKRKGPGWLLSKSGSQRGSPEVSPHHPQHRAAVVAETERDRDRGGLGVVVRGDQDKTPPGELEEKVLSGNWTAAVHRRADVGPCEAGGALTGKEKVKRTTRPRKGEKGYTGRSICASLSGEGGETDWRKRRGLRLLRQALSVLEIFLGLIPLLVAAGALEWRLLEHVGKGEGEAGWKSSLFAPLFGEGWPVVVETGVAGAWEGEGRSCGDASGGRVGLPGALMEMGSWGVRDIPVLRLVFAAVGGAAGALGDLSGAMRLVGWCVSFVYLCVLFFYLLAVSMHR